MAVIKIRAAGIIPIVFTDMYLSFMRGESSTKTSTVNYSNGSGQNIEAGETLYSEGTIGTEGYLSIKSTNAVTLSGAGSILITATAFPTTTKADGDVTFTYSASPVVIHIDYTSLPVIEDLTVEIENRTPKTFTSDLFTDHFSDFDGDTLSELMIEGDVTGYKFNGVDYISGTWIAIQDIGLLTYTPNDTNIIYEKINNWKGKDSDGQISNT